MIDIATYRCRIGTFNLARSGFSDKNVKHNFHSNTKPKSSNRLFMFLINFLLLTVIIKEINNKNVFHNSHFRYDNNEINSSNSDPIMETIINPFTNMFCGNLYAHCTNGNIINKGVKSFHLNIRSLQNKVSDVKRVVTQVKPHFFGCSECELKKSDNFDVGKLKIPGYNIFFPKSWEKHGYARVVVYYKKNLNCERLSELEDDHLQSIWFKFGFKNSKPGFFCHTYREFTSNLGNSFRAQQEKLNLLIEQCESALSLGNREEDNEIYVMGDFNLDSRRWHDNNYPYYGLSQNVIEFCDRNNVDQLVTEITRVQFNSVSRTTDMSCIDHLYTNCKYKCSNPILQSFGDSDHDIIGFVRLTKEPPEPAKTIRKRSYANFNKESFLHDLSLINWSAVYTCIDLDNAVEIFTNIFNDVLNKHAPWIMFQNRKNFKPWITSSTKDMMKARDLAKEKFKRLSIANNTGIATTEEADAWFNYTQLRNQVTTQKRNDETNYKKETVEKNVDDAGSMWASVKGFMNWKSTGTPNQIEKDNKLYTKSWDVANIMNEFFINKISRLRTNFLNTAPNMDFCKKAMGDKKCKLQLQFVTQEKVLKILKKIKSNKSTGIDGLDGYSVKLAAEHIAPVLHHIITLSIMQCKFPSSWKLAKVLPLHKKQNKLEPKNYRPVSILSPLSKVLENVIYDQVYSYFSRNDLFHPSMMGFRKNRSTLTALLQMYDRWVQSAANGKINGVLLCDLSAAFDLVNKDILLEKLKIYGIDTCVSDWINSYMSDRKQAVWIDSVYSNLLDIAVGVPQGSILGPLLFIIYASDLPHCVSCDIDSYADDSSLTSRKRTLQEISEDLTTNGRKVSQWMKDNQLCLNADKTHILVTGTSRKLSNINVHDDANVQLEGLRLQESEEKCENIFGVIFQSELKWNKQVLAVCAKLKQRLGGLSKIRHVANTRTKKLVADGIFTSILTYCIPVWGGMDQNSLIPYQVNLEVFQESATSRMS